MSRGARTFWGGSSCESNGREGSHCRPQCHRFPIEDHIWWVSTKHGKKQCNWWFAACGGQYNWRNPNGVSVIRDSADPSEAKMFRAHLGESAGGRGGWRARGVRETASWMGSLKLCAATSKIMDEPRIFIKMDNHEVVKIGDWRSIRWRSMWSGGRIDTSKR